MKGNVTECYDERKGFTQSAKRSISRSTQTMSRSRLNSSIAQGRLWLSKQKTAPVSHSGNETSAALMAARLMAASEMKPLQDLFEAGRLDVLEQRRRRRQLRRVLKCYIERPVTDRRLIN